MRKLAIALVLATMAASPALAQSFSPGYGTGNIAPAPGHTLQQPFEYQPTDRMAAHWQVSGEGRSNANTSAEVRVGKHHSHG